MVKNGHKLFKNGQNQSKTNQKVVETSQSGLKMMKKRFKRLRLIASWSKLLKKNGQKVLKVIKRVNIIGKLVTNCHKLVKNDENQSNIC
jgi:hypothetical protein